ncbi:unnamed protein product, partial [Closterium sp. NIES-64]
MTISRDRMRKLTIMSRDRCKETRVSRAPALLEKAGRQVVCVGEAVREFVPVVRRSSRQAPDEIFATWRNLQWVPPDFARAPGGPACQVAVALARLNADVAFVGAVGDDEAGNTFLEILESNGVSTRGVDMRGGLRTGAKLISLEKAEAQAKDGASGEELESRGGEVLRGGVIIKKSNTRSASNAGTAWRARFPLAEEARDVAGQEEGVGEEEEEERQESGEGRGDGERRVKALAAAAASGGGVSEDAQDVLRQASWIHCTSMSLATPSDRTALLAALDAAGCHPLASSPSSPPPSHSLTPSSPHSSPHSPPSPPRLFLDVTSPSASGPPRASASAALDPVWRRASVVEVSRAEAEFLVGEERFLRRRQARVRYASDSYLTLRGRGRRGRERGVYHWKPEELAGLWHEGMDLLLVTHGTMQVHYYGRGFHGWVEGARVHYYGRGFHGWVEGTEDVLIAANDMGGGKWGGVGGVEKWVEGTEDELISAMTCDRAGSGDALGQVSVFSIEGLLRKLSTNPAILRDQDALERAIRFAISAGVISSWTTGAYHPDVSQASGSARAFQAIVAAYEVLSDDQQRRLYDLSVQRAATSVRTAASRAAAGRGATVARGASVRVAGAPNRSSPRHWSSVSSATSAHGSSASLDPFDRAFSASVRPSVEPGPGSAQASTSECPIFSAWYLRWLFHARWALAVQQRARRVAAFKTRSSGGMSPSYAATGMSRGAWRGEHEAHEEEQGHGGGERKWRHAQRDKLDWRTGDGAGQEAGRSRWRGAEQAGSDGLLEQGGLLEGDECSSGRGGVAAAAASGGGGVAAAAGGGSGGVEQGATLAGEKPEWRASFGSDLVFILVSIILGVLYGTNATLAWLSLVLILSANTRLGLKVAGAVAWRLGGMPGLGIGVGLHALSFLLGNVHHEAVGAMALVVWMGRRGMGGGEPPRLLPWQEQQHSSCLP